MRILSIEDDPVSEKRGLSWRKRGTLLALVALVTATILNGQEVKKSKVTVIVSEDEAPCFAAKVVIRPRGDGNAKTKSKDEIVLVTDLSGKTEAMLGPGRYRITAVDSIQNKVPALVYFEIKPGESRPIKIRLALIYWDCAHVTCKL
jgi:hypothetical protein